MSPTVTATGARNRIKIIYEVAGVKELRILQSDEL
jgi:hypothetical protein